jgi:membrane-bound serine protease (ClpP class)
MALVITLLVVGAVLLFLEVILPGGIVGLIGLGCLVAAVIFAYMNVSVPAGNWVLFGVVTGLVVGTAAAIKYLPRSRILRPLVSQSSVGDIGTERPELLDQTGTAFTNLRPSGTALINGKRVDVVTEGGMIEAGTPVKVVAVEGLRVVVRAV